MKSITLYKADIDSNFIREQQQYKECVNVHLVE